MVGSGQDNANIKGIGSRRRSLGFIDISIVAGEKGKDRIVYPYSKYQTNFLGYAA